MRVHVDAERPNPRKLQPAVDALKKGQVIVYPTDTGYAFGCAMSSAKGIAAIRRLKAMLGQVHLSDATRTSWKHDRAGLGTVRFDLIKAALAEIGFGGIAIVEVISADAVADTKATLEAWGR